MNIARLNDGFLLGPPGAVEKLALRRRPPALAAKAKYTPRPLRQPPPWRRHRDSLPAAPGAPAPRSKCASACAGSSGGPADRAASRPQQGTAAGDAVSQGDAWQLLQEFTRLNARGMDQGMLDSAAKRQRLRAATLVNARCLCADSFLEQTPLLC